MAWSSCVQPSTAWPDAMIQERFLGPGDLMVGDASMRLKTILGSCVAVTFWDPQRQIGAMCHYLLPARPRRNEAPPDPRYGDEAIGMVTEAFRKLGIPPVRVEVRMFGGGNMFPDLLARPGRQIGAMNAQEGLRLLGERGFKVHFQDLEGLHSRLVVFDIATGLVEVVRRDQPGERSGLAGKGSGRALP